VTKPLIPQPLPLGLIMSHKFGRWTRGVFLRRGEAFLCPHSPFPSSRAVKAFEDIGVRSRGRGANHNLLHTQGGGRSAPLPWAIGIRPLQGQDPLPMRHSSIPRVQHKRCGTRSAIGERGAEGG
jgi:hypothetical protein